MAGSRSLVRRHSELASRQVRAARGATGAVISTLFAAAAHTLAGGHATVFAIVATSMLALPLCVLLAGRVASLWRLTLAIGGSQLLYHWAFAGLGTVGSESSAPAPLHAAHLAAMQSFSPDVSLATASVAMWLGHALGAAVTIALIYRGERAALALLRVIRRAVPFAQRAYPGPITTLTFTPSSVTTATRLRDRLFSEAAITHRGPPLAKRPSNYFAMSVC